MKILKKFFSFFLGNLMLITGTNVLAGGDDKEGSKSPTSSERLPVINVAVVGDDDKGKKDFIKSYTRMKGQRYYGVQSYRLKHKEKTIKFFDIPSDLGKDSDDELEKKWINNFLKSSKKNSSVPYCTYVIICLNVDTEKEELVKRAYEWLKEIKSRNKDYQMQLVLYAITEKNTQSNYEKISAVLDVLNNFEYEFMKQNPGIEQFRSYTSFPFGKEKILDLILKSSKFYTKNINNQNSTELTYNSSGVALGVLAMVSVIVFAYFGIK